MLAHERNQDPAGPHPASEGAVAGAPGLLRFAPTIYQVAAFAVLAAIFIVAMLPQIETDFFWHLKVGAYITAHHVVPSRDFMSFTFNGHPWTDHEWLSELGLLGLYTLAGLWGPIVAFAFFICAAFVFVYANMRARGVHPVLALFVLAGAFTASRGSWGPRIQMLSMLLVAVYSFTLYRYQVTRDRRLLAVFPVLMVIWTNVHGGFVLGLVLITITLVGEWLNRITRHEDALSSSDLRALFYCLVATTAVTIINPNGVRQLLYPLTFILPNAYTNQIQESASPNFHMLVMMVFEALLLLLVASAFLARPRFNWTNLFLILAFTHLALSQVRNVPLWVVVVGPLLARYLQDMAPVLREQFPRFTYRRRPVRGRLVPVFNSVLLLMVLIAYAAEVHAYITPRALDRAQHDNFPIGAVAYLQHHSLPSHVFVSYGWAGYLLWNLFPRYRDFMDSRADTLYDSRILNAYLNAYSGTRRWKTVLKDYQVQDVLIEPDAPLAQLLAQTPGWQLVYHDGGSVLYTKEP